MSVSHQPADLTGELLRAVSLGEITPGQRGYAMYGVIDVDAAVRRLVARDLVALRPGHPPMLTAQGEDLLAAS